MLTLSEKFKLGTFEHPKVFIISKIANNGYGSYQLLLLSDNIYFACGCMWIKINENRLIVSLVKICRKFLSGTFTCSKVAVFLKVDFEVGYPQIML